MSPAARYCATGSSGAGAGVVAASRSSATTSCAASRLLRRARAWGAAARTSTEEEPRPPPVRAKHGMALASSAFPSTRRKIAPPVRPRSVLGLVEVLDEGAGEHRRQIRVERADRWACDEELDPRHGRRHRLLRGGDDGARGRPGAVMALQDEEHLAARAIAEHRGDVAQRVAQAGVLGVEA